MNKNLLIILGLIVSFILPVNAGTLALGEYNNPKPEEAWDGFNMQNAPIIFTYNHSGTQVIYQSEELAEMKGQQITSLSFKCFSENCYVQQYKSSMKIFLQEIDAKEFYYDEVGEYYEWVEFDQNNVTATKEFTGDFLSSATNAEDIEITFDLSGNPYTYTGKTLVVTVVNDSEQCIDSNEGAVRFYWIGYTGAQHPWSSTVFASDEKDFFTNQYKDNAVKPLDNEDMWKNAPAVKFTYQSAKTTPFSGGEGTAEKPYLISSVEDLQEMDVLTNQNKTLGVYFELTKDLTEVPFTGVIGSVENFLGEFNGNNHCILLDINKPESNFVGLFGCVLGGTIENLQVSGSVIGSNYVGGAAGQVCQNAYVENVVNYCDVTGNSSIGGVIGDVTTQEPSMGCIIRQCANYGTISGNFMSGGVIGGCGQQVGNDVQRIANYGYINDGYKPGGLIGNCRPYDRVYFGMNAGAASPKSKALGCIGNTKSATIGDLYCDGQYINNPKEDATRVKMTTELIGDGIKSTEVDNGFSEKYWLFAENLYPRLKINGLENSDIFKLYATPIILAADNTLNNVTTDFTVITENGVNWTSKNGKVSISGNKATPIALGEDVLVATLNGISRELPINVTKFNGVENIIGNMNSVSAKEGTIILNLTDAAFVQVINVAGQTIANGNFVEGQHEINVNGGIYIVRIANETFKVCVLN